MANRRPCLLNEEYHLYNLYSDPQELVNLAGGRETREIGKELREPLQRRILKAGEENAEIKPKPLYP